MVTRLPFVAALAFVAACAFEAGRTTRAPEAEVRATITGEMARYLVAARTVDAGAMAAFFAPTGVLFEPGIDPIRSPDSIRAFLASFPGVRVDSATAVPDTIEVFGNTALLWGTYFERLAFPGQPVSEQDGQFVIEWVRQPGGRWLIQYYYRIPLPARRPAVR